MNISRWLVILVTLLQIVAVVAQNETVKFECIQSFEYFAYAVEEDFTESDQLDIDWIPQYKLPRIDETSGEIIYYEATLLFSRTINGEQEIWLGLSTYPNVYEEPVFGVYRVSDKSLTLIPRRIGNSSSVSIASALIVDDSGTIWARAIQYIHEPSVLPSDTENPYPSSYASVAMFDESISEFVPSSGAPQIPLTSDLRVEIPPTQLIFDSSGTLWLFEAPNKIYHFDSVNRTFQLALELNEAPWGGITPTLDGSILTFLGSTPEDYYFGQRLPLEDYIFEIFLNTGEVRSLPPPPISLDRTLPVFIDQNNRIWFSAMAYLADGQWTVLNPDPDQTQETLSQIQFPSVWRFPTPILSDSKGRMWFQTRGDTEVWVVGAAWFDPETGDGCKFSHLAINVIEDHNGFLWLYDPTTSTLYRSAD